MQWDDGRIRLMPGDCRDLIAMLPDNSLDSVVTDPPYEIGFMNLGFDSTSIAFDVILWKDILRVLKPGGHVAAFAASRTYHRLACAIEDAGFEIRDQIDWVYASGMPHGSDARLLVDRELGAERTHVVGKGHAGAGYSDTNGFGGSSTANGGKAKSEWDALATEQGEQWSGWYSQLKPAHEPICLARKPLDGTLAHNLLGHGTGALHIDACRVPFRNTADEKEPKNKNRHADFNSGPRDNHIYGADKADRTDYTAEARFTPNMLFDQSTAKELDRQSGVTVSRKGKPRASTKPGDGWSMTHTGAEYDDAGGASPLLSRVPVLSEGGTGGEADRGRDPPSDGETVGTDALAGASGHAAGRARVGAVRRQRRHVGGVPDRGRALRGGGDGFGLRAAHSPPDGEADEPGAVLTSPGTHACRRR